MDSTAIPDVITAYQDARDRRDADSALACFGDDASVTDDGITYTGTERISWWLTNIASEYTYTRTVTGIDDLGDGVHVVHNHLSGNFPGNEVDLHDRFQVRDGRIHRLEIAP